MIPIAICDDEKKEIELLNELLLCYAKEHKLDFQIYCYENGEELLNSFFKDKPQIIFLDIYMNGISGIQTAQQLRQIDGDVRIIFVSSSNEYYGEGFAVDATHYLIKPADYKQLSECLRRCEKIFLKEEKSISIKVRQQELKIKHSDIFYIEAVRNGIEIHHKNGSTKVYMPFSQIIKSFDNDDFLQCHRAIIVNLQKVDNISNDCFIMQNKTIVPIRKVDVVRIKALYFNYFMNTLKERTNN